MEEYVVGVAEAVVARGILGFAKQLRTALLAAGPEPQCPTAVDWEARMAAGHVKREMDDEQRIRDAQREVRVAAIKQRAAAEERAGASVVEAVEADGSVVHLPL